MFRNLFNPESPLMVTMTQITDCIFLSLFWLLGCFPVVTMGASFAALYDATFRCFRRGEKNSWRRFAKVFRENWKAGILPTVVFLVAVVCSSRGLIWMWNSAVAGNVSWAVFSGVAFFGMVVMGTISLLFPVFSRFENSLAGLLRNTVLLALANLPRTLILGILNTLAALACLRYILPVFILPSLAALLGSLLIEPMFKPFLNQNEDAAA